MMSKLSYTIAVMVMLLGALITPHVVVKGRIYYRLYSRVLITYISTVTNKSVQTDLSFFDI